MTDQKNEPVLELSENFSEKAVSIPVSAVHLPARTERAVQNAGAINSAEAAEFIINSLSKSPGIGENTFQDSMKAVQAFVRKVERCSAEDLCKLADPRELFFESSQGNVVDAFPGVVELYFDKKYLKDKKRNLDIVIKRFSLKGGKQYTLEELGTYYDVTRERIRQIEAKSIKEIGFLLSGMLKTKNWRIDDSIVNNYNELKKQLSSSPTLILYQEVNALFDRLFDSRLSSGYLDFFMEVAGFVKLPHTFEGFRGTIKPCWCLASQYKNKELEGIFKSLDILFDKPSGFSLFDLTILSKKKAKKKISNESLSIALTACKEVEVVGEVVRVKFVYLRSAADKAFRILETAGKPIHYSAITREINLLVKDTPSYRAITATNVKNQLVSDDRFSAIGRSGEWGLSKWSNLNTHTIVEAIVEVLHRSGKPMKFQDIVNEVHKLRPDAAKNSISVYINQKDQFARVGNAEYALSSWRLAAKKKRITKVGVDEKLFLTAVNKVLDGRNKSGLPELINGIMNETNLSEASVRQRLLKANYLDVRPEKGKKYKIVRLIGDNIDIESIPPNKILLRDKVQDEIRSILFDHPNVPYKKADLYSEICKNVKCLRPTFYRYLDEMDDVRQYKEGNKYYAIYDHAETHDHIELNLEQFKLDLSIEEELQRPLSKLTVDQVDIGLFELGLIFESKLKDFLLKAKSKNVFTVNKRDLGRLVDMINCVIREGVVTKGHHLNTLREERNKRAHGTKPSLKERENLLNKAHYVAELFVKYIAFFHSKKCAL